MSLDLWQGACDRLAAELPEQQFLTWIRPLPPADISDAGTGGLVACLRVANRFKLDWIRSQYSHRIEAVLGELAGKPVRLELALAPREAPVVTGLRPLPSRPHSAARVLANAMAVASQQAVPVPSQGSGGAADPPRPMMPPSPPAAAPCRKPRRPTATGSTRC